MERFYGLHNDLLHLIDEMLSQIRILVTLRTTTIMHSFYNRIEPILWVQQFTRVHLPVGEKKEEEVKGENKRLRVDGMR